MTYGSQTKRVSEELEENDMFSLGGISYIVSKIDRNDPDWLVVDADQMIGRSTWSIQIRIPNGVPFMAQT